MELWIPFYGILSAGSLRYPARSFDLRQLLSASIAVYRPQAEIFGGRFDGKFDVASEKVSLSQVLTSAGDNGVGVTRAFPHLSRSIADKRKPLKSKGWCRAVFLGTDP
jgi:hypothetical protein